MTSDKVPIGRDDYYVPTDKLKEQIGISPKQKLEWLEEIASFLEAAMPEKNKKIWQTFRKGNFLS